jgi:DnaD/phage-associated family protein
VAGNYWIKLYLEILDDSKMAVLPDRLWRRVTELFLLAGKFGKKGALPETIELAWLLRLTKDDLDLDMIQIAATGIICKIDTGWLVVNFTKRQAPVSEADRALKHRMNQHKDQYYGHEDVTKRDENVTQINRLTDTDTDTEPEPEPEPRNVVVVVSESSVNPPNIFSLYENNIGFITPLIRDKLLEAEKDHPPDWIKSAFEIAVGSNARNWNYVAAILSRWKTAGYDGSKPSPNGYHGKRKDGIPDRRDTPEARAKYAEDATQ